jgi:serine/threonine protein kinase
MPGLEGTSLGRYHLKRRLGRGGMAEVYLASDERMHREVAIKVVRNSHTEFAERFSREAQAMGKLHHDHILVAYDYGEQEMWNYLVMPYLEHGTLHDLLQKGPLSLEHAGELLEQIADGLQYAHQHDLLHRDIKPSNILLRDDHYAYLSDFGLARTQEGGSDLTQTGTLLGTPEYMAPELADGPATVSTDVYALAVVLYYMLSGRVPFRGETAISTFWKHMRETPEPPSRFNVVLPKAVDLVLMRALEKDPTQRYATPLALSQAYQGAISGRETTPSIYETDVIQEKPASSKPPVTPVNNPTPPAAPPRITTEKPAPKRRPSLPPLKPTAPPRPSFEQTTDVFVPPTSPTPPPSQRRRRNKRVRGGIVIGLVFLVLAISVIGVLTLKGGEQNSVSATATSQANATDAILSTQTQQALSGQQTATAHQTAISAAATATAITVNATAQAQATQTSAQGTATAITSGPPVESDSLTSQNKNKWAEESTSCQFLNSSYDATVKGTNNQQSCVSGILQTGNNAIQVDTTLLSGDSAGIAFRANTDESQFYDFEITSNGHFFLRYIDHNNTKVLIPDTANSAIHIRGNSNVLLVIAQGNDFKLYVNNTFVGETHDNSRADGKLGVIVSTNSSNRSEATFIDLSIYRA